MSLYARFFTEQWNDDMTPTNILMHEYFHYLRVPGTPHLQYPGLGVIHGNERTDPLASADNLAGFALSLALGRRPTRD
jgi:hypothetical protein